MLIRQLIIWTIDGLLHWSIYASLIQHWLNSSPRSARQWTGSALVQIMACRLIRTKPLPEPILTYCQLDPQEQTSVKFIHESAFKNAVCEMAAILTRGRWVNPCTTGSVFQIIIKSPQYTGGDFMFLYRFVRRRRCRRRCRRRRRRPQILVHAITFEQLFRISFIFGTIVGPDL